jgi:hypothetical protein
MSQLRVSGIATTAGTEKVSITKLSSGGFYTRNILTQIDTVSRTSGTGYTLGPTFDNISCAGNSLIKMMYHVPIRNDSTGWGGIYIEPQISFNDGAWQSLGTTGHEMMINGAPFIMTYRNEILITPSITTDFTVKFRFYFRAYDSTVGWNNGINHDINAQPVGNATLMTGDNGLQHYMHIIVEEFARLST